MRYFDTNCLVYLTDTNSDYYQSTLALYRQAVADQKLALCDIVFIEFFQVITNSAKVRKAWTPAQAVEFIQNLILTASEVHYYDKDLFWIMLKGVQQHEIRKYAIYDHMIYELMKKNAVNEIVTVNKKDFEKYEFIKDIIVPEKVDTDDNRTISQNNFIPYGKQSITEEDINAVTEVLRSDFLTQGPKIPEFEQAVADYCVSQYGVAVSSATAALQLAYSALDLGPGDELWSSPITFVATSNAAFYCGASVDFVDVEPDTGNLSVEKLAQKLAERQATGGKLPKVVAPVHLGGLSCDMQSIAELARQYGFKVVEDASHAIGGSYQGAKVGSCTYSDIAVFSFHPVKVMTTGEGGMALTNDKGLADAMERLRSHGVTRESGLMDRTPHGAWYYQQIELGYNYRMTEMQASLGLTQLKRLDEFVRRRNELADRYDELLADLPFSLPGRRRRIYSAFHLYAVRIGPKESSISRKELFDKLRGAKIGVQIHYIPVHTQPYYQKLGFADKSWPVAEGYYDQVISLPLYFSLSEKDQDRVVEEINRLVQP